MKRILGIALSVMMALPQVARAAQKDATSAVESVAFQRMAAAIPLGARVKVETRSGRRLTATLMDVTDEGVLLKRETRVPEAAVQIRYDDLSSLRRHEPRGIGLGKALGIGLAAGAGAMLTLVLVILAVED